jgi:nicotinamidase-related amidase
MIWNDLLSALDKQVIEDAGYMSRGASTFSSRSQGESPALLIVDMQRLFVGADVPILEALAEAPTMIGEAGWRAIECMSPLIEQVQKQGFPVIYAKMMPHNVSVDDPLLTIVDALQPCATDKIINKTTSSMFFQTGLTEYLRSQGCDSVILVGNSTSGCIRTAAVDANQYGFSVYVPYECVFDRIEASHKIGLLDMWMKYANVLSTSETIERLQSFQKQQVS